MALFGLIVECDADQRVTYTMYDLAAKNLKAVEMGFADSVEEAKDRVVALANQYLENRGESREDCPTWTPYFNKIAAHLAHL